MAGMLLYCLKQAAKPISTDESNCHRRRIEEDEAFYKNWLFPRFERFYRQQGWAVGERLGVVEPAGGSSDPSNKTKKAKSRRSCSPFGRKPGPRVKRALKRLKLTRRRDQPPEDVIHPQVGTLLELQPGFDCLAQWQWVCCISVVSPTSSARFAQRRDFCTSPSLVFLELFP